MKEYCRNCTSQWKECGECGEKFCNECIKTMKECDGEDCTDQLCEKCIMVKTCIICDRTRCGDCATSYECSRSECAKVICDDCVKKRGEGGRGGTCWRGSCSTECLYLECDEDGETMCEACLAPQVFV